MVTGRVGLNLVTLKNGLDAARLRENLDRTARAGFQGVGLWVQTIEQWLSSGHTVAQLAREVEARGLTVDELCFVSVLDEAGRVADHRLVFQWAQELGCGTVITIHGNPGAALEKIRADWAAFVEKVQQTGVSPAFEFIGSWPRYNSPLAAWQVIEEGPDLGSMVFDTFHFWRGGCDLTQIGTFPAERISLVHLNDAKDVPRQEAVDADRTYPGEGSMPLKEILRSLVGSGFIGPFSVEIFGEVQQQDPDEAAAHAYESAARILKAL